MLLKVFGEYDGRHKNLSFAQIKKMSENKCLVIFKLNTISCFTKTHKYMTKNLILFIKISIGYFWPNYYAKMEKKSVEY